MQDVDPYEREVPLVFENISDTYKLVFEAVQADAHQEIEPNDEITSATLVAPGNELSGTLSFMRDVDVICPSAEARAAHASFRWTIRDAIERARDPGSVLEVTPLDPTALNVTTRIHRAGVEGKDAGADIHSPWVGPVVHVSDAPGSGCIQLKLARDPWSTSGVKVPRAGTERYHVRLDPVP
jgi:hypothetical protein